MGKVPAEGRVPAISAEDFYNRVADTDTRAVPAYLRDASTFDGDHYEITTERFLSKDYLHREVELLWKKVWQVACREEEIPHVGDVHVYEVATLQFLIVRTSETTIKAFPNSCLHRGRQLVDCDKRVSEIRCPFHGFTWDLDGRISSIPCAWEFSHIDDPSDWKLPEARVDTWGGFVFINPDQDAEPLAEYLGDIDRFYANSPMAERYIAGHARKIVPCNWKIAQEAFLEAYHVFGTHPQLMPGQAHTDIKYDCFGNFSRSLAVNYIPNGFINLDLDDQQIVDWTLDRRADQERPVVIDENMPVRQQMAQTARQGYERLLGESSDHISDSEMIDTSFMSVFPNIHPWTLFSKICYRFRPYKDDPDRAWMDVYQLKPFNKAEGRPPAAQVHLLSDDEDWTAAPEIGLFLARISNQDTFNFEPLQRGMKASATGRIRYSSYQESRIRHFHSLLDRFMGEQPVAK